MLVTVSLLLVICGIVQSSGIHPVAPAGSAPIVTAASSQYFERTFNRLVAVPPVFEPAVPVAAPVAPVIPVAPPIAVAPPRPFLSVLPLAPAPPVVVDATRTTSVPVNPSNPPPPPAPAPFNPNIAIAIATAQAAPVSTILLPPYPFGFPPSFGILPHSSQGSADPNTIEATTLKTTTTVQTSTTKKEEVTTPLPSNIDNSFAQASSNQNVNFRQYLAPQNPGSQQTPSGQQFAGSSQRPQQFPIPNQRPEFSIQNTKPKFPVPNPRPEYPLPNLPSVPSGQQFSGSNQRPQQFPIPNQRPEFPIQNTRPQLPVPNQRPQLPVPNQRPQLPVPNPWPQNIPQHLPLPDARPIKFKTNVEVVPVPLEYIAPPSTHQHYHHNHHHHPHHHQSLKVVPHIHKFIPKTSKIIIIRPVTSKIKTLRVPAGFATYGPPRIVKRLALKHSRNIRSNELLFRPINNGIKTPGL